MNRKPFYIFLLLLMVALPAQAFGKKTILCSTYPIFQITRNVVNGHNGMKIQLLLPAALGCPHDYALTPRDMQKLAKADVLVVNGLGMEEFLGAPVEKANPGIKIIDSSAGIDGILNYTDKTGPDDHVEKNHRNHGEQREKHHHAHDHEGPCDHDHHHDHTGANPHLFASPGMAGRLALNIAAELTKIDPSGASVYINNAQAYRKKMMALAADFSTLGQRLKNNRVVFQHGVFDYLAKDTGLSVVAVIQAHPGREPSAAEMLALVKTVGDKNAGAVFTEPQYPPRVGQTIARETGIPTATLDPVANGPENAPLGYYESVMRKNLHTLEITLGTK